MHGTIADSFMPLPQTATRQRIDRQRASVPDTCSLNAQLLKDIQQQTAMEGDLEEIDTAAGLPSIIHWSNTDYNLQNTVCYRAGSTRHLYEDKLVRSATPSPERIQSNAALDS